MKTKVSGHEGGRKYMKMKTRVSGYERRRKYMKNDIQRRNRRFRRD